MYAIVNHQEMNIQGDLVKISQNYDSVILTDDIPKQLTIKEQQEEDGFIFVFLQKPIESKAQTLTFHPSIVQSTQAALADFVPDIPVHISIIPENIEGVTTIVLKPASTDVSLFGYAGKIYNNLPDNVAMPCRLYSDQTLIGYGGKGVFYLFASSKSKSGWVTLITQAIKAIKTPLAPKNNDEQIIKAMGAIYDKKRENFKNAVAEHKESIEVTRESYIGAIRAYERSLEALEALVAMGDNQEKLLRDELAGLRKIQDIEHISCSGQNLLLTTSPLIMDGAKGKKLLGRVSIVINMTSGSILFQPIDMSLSKRPHPHTQDGGNACFGTASADIARLVADYELNALTQMLLMFLKQYRIEDSWGSTAKEWPNISEDGTIGKIRESMTILNSQIKEGVKLEEAYS